MFDNKTAFYGSNSVQVPTGIQLYRLVFIESCSVIISGHFKDSIEKNNGLTDSENCLKLNKRTPLTERFRRGNWEGVKVLNTLHIPLETKSRVQYRCI